MRKVHNFLSKINLFRNFQYRFFVGFSSGVVILAARAFGFLVMFFFKDMILVVGQHGVYLFFAGVCLCGLVFSYFFIPETRKRNMEDIQTDIQQHWFFHRVKYTDSFNPNA